MSVHSLHTIMRVGDNKKESRAPEMSVHSLHTIMRVETARKRVGSPEMSVHSLHTIMRVGDSKKESRVSGNVCAQPAYHYERWGQQEREYGLRKCLCTACIPL